MGEERGIHQDVWHSLYRARMRHWDRGRRKIWRIKRNVAQPSPVAVEKQTKVLNGTRVMVCKTTGRSRELFARQESPKGREDGPRISQALSHGRGNSEASSELAYLSTSDCG